VTQRHRLRANHLDRSLLGVGIAVAALVLSGCAGVSLSNSAASPSVAGPLPTCTADQIKDPVGWLSTYTAGRDDLKKTQIAWQGVPLTSKADSITAIARATMLPCDPNVDPSNITAAPANVQLVASLIGPDDWKTLVHEDVVGTGAGGGPAPSGFSDPAASYRTFLNLVGRFPLMCNEAGVWDSKTEACQRELSAIFAHAAQETGAKPPPSGYVKWQVPFAWVREQTCYPDICTKYDSGASALGAPADAHFYGRGMVQLSYPYNYANFSAAMFGDYTKLANTPDLVAQSADMVIGSGIWFVMTPQPPKPSMHDVLVGTYKPVKAADGIATDSNGSVTDKFAATVSIINGGIECSPSAGDGGTQALKDQAIALTESRNRFDNYKSLLNFFKAKLTSVEDGYTADTYCLIDNGNPFAASPADLGYQPYMYFNNDMVGCPATNYGGSVPLSMANPGMGAVCQNLAPKSSATASP